MENCQQLLLPSLQGGGGGGGGGDDVGNRSSLGEVELMSIDQCQKIPDMNDSQRADVAVNGVEVVEMSGGKRRRGRPPRNQARVVSSSSASTPQRKTQDEEEEDVCFICFDGGSLVLCDRRGCPKAYHPACIKRDEAFFKSAAKWNCGWHICSTCQKASYYMCYTCTFSTCKKCTKDADYVNVRGNKGFCGLCMRMIMLIESTALGTKETVQVDFDDQNSWEYLFKVYWTLLKEKLSLSLAELIKAKNPWKEIASTERSFGGLGSSYSKRRKMMKQQIESLEAQKSGVMKGTLPEGKSRVSEEKDTKEHALLLGMKEKEPASTLKGVDVLSDIESRESSVTPQPTEMELSVNNIETDIIWRYQDPHGKIQGPFSMETLRRWSVSGYFPPGLRIWRANERQENSILLTDALDGRYSPVQQVYHNSRVPTEDIRFAPNDGYQKRDGDVRESWDLNVDQTESKQVEERSKSMQNDASVHSCDINESAKSKESGSRSYCTAPVDIVTSNLVQTGNHVKGDNCFPGQPQVSSSLPSSSSSGKPCETQSHLVISGHGVDKRVCSSINMNENLNKTSESQIIAGNVKQDDSEGKSGKSCGQSWRSPLNDSSNGWDSNCGLISLVRALEASENNHYNDFPDLPTSTSGLNHEDSKPLGTKNEQSLSSSTLHQDSGPSWSTASSLVGNGPKLSEVAGECGRYSSVPAKPSAEEWDSDRVPESLKRTNLGSDLAATPTSGSGQLTHSSPTDAAEKASGWDSIILEPNEYSFGDESVSDLLAEVEAMESLNGVASPTSNLRCDGELAQGVELDFFSPVGGLSPALDPGKSDALSSTNDLRMPSQSTVSNEPIGVSQSEVLDAQKSSCGHSPSDVSVNQYEAGSDMQLPAPPSTTWGMTAIDTTWREVRETTGTNCEAIQGYPNFNLEGLGQGTRNIGWGTGQVTFQDNGRVNPGMYYGTQQRYLSPKGPDIQGRDSSSSRGRSSMHRHSTYGAPPLNAVGSFRPPPKGQRVCKFYERGDCKKGASCSYWHP